jgi:hypothetical protein
MPCRDRTCFRQITLILRPAAGRFDGCDLAT